MKVKNFTLFLSLLTVMSAHAIDLPNPVSTPSAPKEAPGLAPSAPVGRGVQPVGGRNPSAMPKAVRQKDMNFEGRGVEVLLGKDYDSLSQTGTVEPANRDKLYKTRQFMNESENLLQELEYTR
ncbi:MAG: hypothetical protein EOP09_13920 [Proteobacteria bacterium]|nr:MAG: hypothetical protein EOP09_13920 [Pseudomonadota bacterium]